ncbi:Ig-like domain-containing protein, partial [Serratia sp. N21D137]|uniref:Ig-like domain-containing protein n=1 Tax=Serratia sp. N21D137 TaxID=3397495 RepID=UPI0039E066B2
ITANGVDASELTLALTDVNGNPVTGAAVAFETVLTNTAFSAVTENAGVYTARMSGTTAGSAVINVRINGIIIKLNEGPVVINLEAGEIDVSKSSFITNKSSVWATGWSSSDLTLSLFDSFGNKVTKANMGFFTDLGTVSSTTETKEGVYTASVTSGTVTGVATISIKQNNLLTAIAPQKVTFVTPPKSTLVANSYSFQYGNGFPTTGFVGAIFDIYIFGDSSSNTQYTWSSNYVWASVSDKGRVTLKSMPDATQKKLKITAKPISGGDTLVFDINISKWFYQAPRGSWSTVNNYCSNSSGVLPDASELSLRKRAEGALWGEWGYMGTYGLSTQAWWTSTVYIDTHLYVYMDSGTPLNNSIAGDSNSLVAYCYRKL